MSTIAVEQELKLRLSDARVGIACSIGNPSTHWTDEILGTSDGMTRLRTQIRRLGPYYRTVLLRGERGTGKHLVARALHGSSAHSEGPFVLWRSRLKSKTSVEDNIATALRAAHRGTLYLSQIEAMSEAAQAELLAALMSRQRLRCGPIVVHGLEARIIAATTEDLRVLTATGRFRTDLYSRLTTVEMEMPPLRERVEDIPLLAQEFVDRYAGIAGKALDNLPEEYLAQLQAHGWPGNVRELKELMRRVVEESAGGRIEAEIVRSAEQLEVRGAPEFNGLTRLQEVVEQHVFQVLKECAGNKVKAAEVLGISRSTLYRMLDAGLQGDKLVVPR
jgi:DNA-binding NtrC family response regulator